ncbi:MAG: hypothetical protein AAF958_18710, partial [Planctomycetota bacterium]
KNSRRQNLPTSKQRPMPQVQRRRYARIAGIILWTGVFGWLLLGKNRDVATRWATATTRLITPPRQIAFHDPSGQVRPGDAVFLQSKVASNADFRFCEVGRVRSVDRETRRGIAEIQLGESARNQPDGVARNGSDEITRDQLQPLDPSSVTRHRWTCYRNSGSISETSRLLFPAETRSMIRTRIRTWADAHGRQVAASMMPIVREALIESIPIIEAELEASLVRHEDDWNRLIAKFQSDVLEQQLVPIAKSDLMPIVRKHGEPVAGEIGRELWDRASLWRFSWRAVYDKSPLPQKDLVAEEWDRFVEDDAIPVFEAHLDEVADAVLKMVGEASANPKIRRAIGHAASTMAEDPLTRKLLRQTVRESLVDNQRLRDVWKAALESPRARAAMDAAGDSIEPLVREIGDQILGTPEAGISPGFARVLRRQVLGRDRRWIVIDGDTSGDQPGSAEGDTVTIEDAGTEMDYPIVHLVAPESQS